MGDPPVGDATAAEIRRRLERVESEEDVVIGLAVESGSRAWGFWSKDSDYDVRFLYVRRPEAYLSIRAPRDVIERPIVDEIDLNGWDLRKALGLFMKSNPPLLEWLQCPFIYRKRSSLAERMRALLPAYFAPNASFAHYSSMAKKHLRRYLDGKTVWRKKYFYVLRPLLAMRWIERGLGPVPIEFAKLVEATVEEPPLRRAIDDLLVAKRAGAELDEGPRIPELSDFVDAELRRHEATTRERDDPTPSVDRLDALFRATLKEVWGASLPD